MIRRNVLLPSLYIALAACGSAARTPDGPTVTEASPAVLSVPRTQVVGGTRSGEAAKTDHLNGDALSIKLSNGRSVTLQGFKVDAKHGLSTAQCGVTIERQRVMSMGTGETDTYTCGKLIAAGPVPPLGAVERVGLIYQVSSPNAGFRTAAVLERIDGAWRIDPKSAGAFDDQPAGRSIAGLRRMLSKSKQ